MKTFNANPSNIEKRWYVVDATGQTVGRLASEIANVLRGKNKPTFTPHMDDGDHVIVTNAEKLQLTGRKWDQKFYYKHTGYIGGIKATRASDMLERNPEKILEIAVKGMLPKNKLSRHQLAHLRVYKGAEHPHAAQNPVELPPRTAKV